MGPHSATYHNQSVVELLASSLYYTWRQLATRYWRQPQRDRQMTRTYFQQSIKHS